MACAPAQCNIGRGELAGARLAVEAHRLARRAERPLNFFFDRRAWSPSTRRATSSPGSRLNQIENADRRKNDGPRKLTH
jgi:hypothetical protein